MAEEGDSSKYSKPGRKQLGVLKLQLLLVVVVLAALYLHAQSTKSRRMMGSQTMPPVDNDGELDLPRLAVGQLGVAKTPYDLILGMTHHKTGTSQMGCLLYHFAYALNLTTPVYQDNFVLAGNIQMFVTRTPDQRLPLAFLTGHEMMKQCYYQNATKHWVICPTQFPCRDGKPILGIGRCFLQLPTINLAALHFVRNPLDVVLSAYLYHTQSPPPEKWIEAMEVPTYMPFLEKRGVPLHRLEALGMSYKAAKELTYGGLLRSLPEERGVHLEFWRTVPMLYAMAQQYIMLDQHPSAMQVRFEDLRFRFNATVGAIADQLYAPHPKEVLLAAAHEAKCDPGVWSDSERDENSHVTWGKDEGRVTALRDSLLRDKSIRRHICTLQEVLGYALEEECEGSGGGNGSRGGGGEDTQQQQQQQQQK